MKTIYLGIIAVLAIIYLVRSLRRRDGTHIEFVPASISQQRVTAVGLQESPKEDPKILNIDNIRFPPKKIADHDSEYRGVPEIEWIVDIHPPKDFKFRKTRFTEVFDYDWRTTYKSTFYAHFPGTDKWSFAIAADSPDEFDSLELAVPLADIIDEKEQTVQRLESLLAELRRRLKQFDVNFEIVPRESVESGSDRSAKLKKFQRVLKSEVIVVLKADKYFKSIEFWNTLTDLGLKWGDGDLFHWDNFKSGIGDQSLFNVWTTTEPGYFLPENVAAKKFKPKDLVFGFLIPRSADAEKVFEMMVQAIEYCHKRLGGIILDQDGNPFNKVHYESMIRKTLSDMTEQGLKPGQGLTLRLF